MLRNVKFYCKIFMREERRATFCGRKKLHVLSELASAKYLEVNRQHKIEKDGEL